MVRHSEEGIQEVPFPYLYAEVSIPTFLAFLPNQRFIRISPMCFCLMTKTYSQITFLYLVYLISEGGGMYHVFMRMSQTDNQWP